MKSPFIVLDKHQEVTKFVNFSTIKGMMTATKKPQKAFGGPPKCLYES
jgi:hypothetical protein